MDTIEKSAPAVDVHKFICNVVPSKDTDRDWRFEDLVESGALEAPVAAPASVDLRAAWWAINDQETTGSCVGWATADGVVRYQMVRARKIIERQLLSARHIWMASKETDEFTARPETFIEEAGTSLKAALDVTRRHGTALATQLPFHISTNMYLGSENAFYASCAQRKIASYINMAKNTAQWKNWLASQKPILVAVKVDASWDAATANGGKIDTFQPATVRGGHAVAVVGYRTDGRFIVRNSWGTGWGDKGFGYVSPAYIAGAFFDESYGVTI
ncbi:MAG TPA: C1 family peptidase [Acidimicrobiales bacterium]|nr:C1 family peptidase [Acidimicrobiales bacterium]